MASIDVKVPDIGGSAGIPVIELLVKPGDTVRKDQGLVTLESDKATMEVPSPAAGVITALKVKLGDEVSEGHVIATLEAAGVPVGRIYTVADIAQDPQYQAREMIVQTQDAQGRPLKVPGIVPKLSVTPGRLRTPAPRLGEHTDSVLAGLSVGATGAGADAVAEGQA